MSSGSPVLILKANALTDLLSTWKSNDTCKSDRGGIGIQLMIVEGCYESEQVAVVGVLNMLVYWPIQHNSTI